MTTRYVGPGGNNSNDGLSWANRKLTLNGVEDSPVAAGDVVYVGPGVYRESLTIDVSGSSGNPITYIGDVTGEHTDGVGGIVRITGSDNDQSATRASCITTASARSYRTFRGFSLDTTTSIAIAIANQSGNVAWIIEDCSFQAPSAANVAIQFPNDSLNCIVRRCVFIGLSNGAIQFTHSSTVDDRNNLVENCDFIGIRDTSGAVIIARVGGVTVKNSTFLGCATAVRIINALAGSQLCTVNTCIVQSCGSGFVATTTAEFIEDYNTLFGNGTNRSNVNAGANSVAYPALFLPPMLLSGLKYRSDLLELSTWSQVKAKAGTGESSDDLFGMARPATSSKKSWGAVQSAELIRETTTVRTGAASAKMADAGRVQQFKVPVTNVSTTFSIYVRWESDYAGTKPQMAIKQPGQSDQTVTATGSAGSWEQLTTTFTPGATPPYVIIELGSNNTAISGNFAVYFDDFVVS